MSSYIEIKPVGGFFPMDENGFVINDTHIDKVNPKWNPILKSITKAYQSHLGAQLHSLYLRGSIARGKEVVGISDIDTFALVHQDGITWQNAAWENQLQQELQKEFIFVREVEVRLSSYHSNIYKANPGLSMVVKTQALCLLGESVIASIPKFKPSKAMMLNYKWIKEDVACFLSKKEITRTDCKEIMKVMIRTGFELVLEQLQKYTTDLYWSYHAFAQYYPQRADQMKKALTYFLNPLINRKELHILVADLGKWLTKEVENKLKV